jgi:hypothetical protein
MKSSPSKKINEVSFEDQTADEGRSYAKEGV